MKEKINETLTLCIDAAETLETLKIAKKDLFSKAVNQLKRSLVSLLRTITNLKALDKITAALDELDKEDMDGRVVHLRLKEAFKVLDSKK